MIVSARPVVRTAAFTLVEMIGVLSVIAILSSVLVPRVLHSIGDARITSAAATCNSVKAAINEYYGRYAKIGLTNGADLYFASSGEMYEDWDMRCLVAEGYMEKPFIVKIGNGLVGSGVNGSRIRVVDISGNTRSTRVANDLAALEGGGYSRGGTAPTNDVLGRLLVEACIEGVDNQDAIDLNARLDGATMGAPLSQNDELGRVKYFVTTNGTAKVRIYLAHR